jgi:hypothetical protein
METRRATALAAARTEMIDLNVLTLSSNGLHATSNLAASARQ